MMHLVFIGVAGIIALGVPGTSFADSLGQTETFFTDLSFDAKERGEIAAVLQKITDRLYFYMEKEWWEGLSLEKRNEVLSVLGASALRFEETTYPKLTSLFGSESNPGIDGDVRLTVVVHQMSAEAGGYIRTADGYSKLQAPESNEREMFYLAASKATSPHLDSFFAHEFMHLIYLNQKELIRGAQDDVWIQEGIAEVAPSLVGLPETFEKSYLEKRVQDFASNPRDSLTEWQNKDGDYGVASLFFHYVKDQYGRELLRGIVHSSLRNIASIDEALQKQGVAKTFSDVFQDWTLAVFLNDCSLGKQYCYVDENLKNVRILPFTSFLSPFGDTELRVTNQTKVWSGNWIKISGSKGLLNLNFQGHSAVSFRVPYLLQKAQGGWELGFFNLKEQQIGNIEVGDFGERYSALIILPAIHDIIRSADQEPLFFFSWSASTLQNGGNNEQDLKEDSVEEIARLLEQIAQLQRQVALLQAQLAAAGGTVSCKSFERNLFFGMSGDADVSCLQEFLKVEGPSIYPEGLVTGNFLSLTHQAVARFQEKYAEDILSPLGLQKGTGFVGPSTRAKLNSLLSQ